MFTFGEISAAQLIPMFGIGVLALAWVVAFVVSRVLRRRRHAATGDHSAIAVQRLTKRYRSSIALDDVSFALAPGRVLALLGPNGAGKTTLLRIVAGLTEPDAGQVAIFGHLITPGAPVLSRVGITIEEAGFVPHRTGRQNLEALWEISGRDRAAAHFGEVIDLTGLGRFVDRPAGTYSQGTRQRLALAQAMLGFPELLILDEPTNGLDPDQIWELSRVLRRYAASGRTVIVASHHLPEVSQLCTDALVIRDGAVAWFGAVSESGMAATTLTIDVDDPADAVAALAAPLADLGLTGPDVLEQTAISVIVTIGDVAVVDVLAAIASARIPVRAVHTPDPLAAIYRGVSAREAVSR